MDTLERLLACCGKSLVMDARDDTRSLMNSPRLALMRRNRQEILALARRHGIGRVRVFGSVARGEDNEDSDVDLLVDYDTHRPGGLMPIIAFAREVEELTGERVDVAPEMLLKPEVRVNAQRDAVVL